MEKIKEEILTVEVMLDLSLIKESFVETERDGIVVCQSALNTILSTALADFCFANFLHMICAISIPLGT